MPDFRYGPVELYLIVFDAERPAPGCLAPLLGVLASGMVRLLDLVTVSKNHSGEVRMLDLPSRELLGLDWQGLDRLGLDRQVPPRPHPARTDPDRQDRDRQGWTVGPDPVTEGLIGEEDLADLAAPLAPGSSAAVLALELRVELALAERLAPGRAQVLRSAQIPAPVVNALIDLYNPVEGTSP
ncbi:hypothetical protein I2485_07880 [Nesterenkonia sp. E16_7]|uniref:DUF6325 family protein n=1 Tax=unclassified Nesterenkonia TaxID=2629769 RepID=UPI001A9165F6|nr:MULTISPECIES: DUF6325 family protein [unclassified Nesterenkonia]MBO0595623.1 hypothetical protein [Nesterenkonia sp. E16_10]MBO0598570.1 hypothetical protein [Nesterenkonia sp. E16_7]